MDEAWIQQSLARLESLEAYKAQVQAGGYAVDLSEVDAEIAALYEVLESAAEPESQPQAPPQPQLYAATPFAAASPFEQPVYAPPISPAMQAPAAPVMMAPAPTYDQSYVDMDVDPPSSKAPFIAIALLAVVGLGTGGWYFTGGAAEKAPEAAPVGDAQVINAASIPGDTQDPQVAKGGDAQRTEGLKIKESHRPAARGNNDRRRPAQRTDHGPKKPSKDDRKVATIDSSRDPLAGAR